MTGQLHILHADDDPEDRWMFEDGLRQVDASVRLTQFPDGKLLLDHLETASPADSFHLVVCDMQMPEMGALQFLDRIQVHQRWRHLPVLIYSTSSAGIDMRACLRNGAVSFYTKPNTYSRHLETIREMLARIPQQQQAGIPGDGD